MNARPEMDQLRRADTMYPLYRLFTYLDPEVSSPPGKNRYFCWTRGTLSDMPREIFFSLERQCMFVHCEELVDGPEGLSPSVN